MQAAYTAESTINRVESQLNKYLTESQLIKRIIEDKGSMDDDAFSSISQYMQDSQNVIEAHELAKDGTFSQVYPMEGTIQVESKTGKGTRFTLVLPFRIATAEQFRREQTQQKAKRLQAMEGKRILLAEDNELNAEIAMTANAFEEDRKKAFDSGMDGYISKPMTIDALFITLEEVLHV